MPQITTCFTLENHTGPYESWPARTRLLIDGRPSRVLLPGYSLLHQFQIPQGYLLVTDCDCPFEETTCFILLDRHKRLHSYRMLFVPYGSFNLEKFEWLDNRQAQATFWGDDIWRLTIRNLGIPFLLPRLHLQQLNDAARTTTPSSHT